MLANLTLLFKTTHLKERQFTTPQIIRYQSTPHRGIIIGLCSHCEYLQEVSKPK